MPARRIVGIAPRGGLVLVVFCNSDALRNAHGAKTRYALTVSRSETTKPSVLVWAAHARRAGALVTALDAARVGAVGYHGARFRPRAPDRGRRRVVLLDTAGRLRDASRMCVSVQRRLPDALVVVIARAPAVTRVVEWMRAGAFDVVDESIKGAMLKGARAAREEAERRSRRDEQRPKAPRPPGGLLGTSHAIHRVHEILARVAPTDLSTVITGESGTGKELAARALHEGSERRDGPFVPINCAALPANLLEGELFGHVAGAFTGARAARDGLLVLAHGGTLFLDEIGELPLELQPKLLRALQEGRVRPLGSQRERGFDARVIAATNRTLPAAVADGTFREDLYYRLNVVGIEMPPLRERGNDIMLLARHFLEVACDASEDPTPSLAPDAVRILVEHDWPGNVRELANAMERAAAMKRGKRIRARDLPDALTLPRSTRSSEGTVQTLAEVERDAIAAALAAHGNNKSRAARALGINRTTLYRKLRTLDE